MIKSQIDASREELEGYPPLSIDWHARAHRAAELILPWLQTASPALKSHVEDVLNAPANLRRLWSSIRDHFQIDRSRIEEFERVLTLDAALRESVTGEVVSKVVTSFLLRCNDQLRDNGRSDYPDLYLASMDYGFLPVFQRRREGHSLEEFGAARKGREQRPVRVPDGLEVKTCRDRIAVDCHYPHVGLHLVLLYREGEGIFTVEDVKIAFLDARHYRESGRSTAATTVKFSFNGDPFVSLLSGSPS